MSGILHQLSQQRLIGESGGVVGASIYFYLSGTTAFANIYSDPALSAPLANPVEVAAGEILPDIYLDTDISYRRRIEYTDGTVDDLNPYEDPLMVLAGITGWGLVGVTGGGTLPDVLKFVTPEQYGAAGDAVSGSSGTDDTSAFQAALDTGKPVYMAGKYIVSELFMRADNQVVFGPGTIYKKTGVNGRVFFIDTHDGVQFVGITIDGTASAPTPGPLNDTIRFQGVTRGVVRDCTINGSKGTGIRFDSSSKCQALNNKVLNCQNNNILVCNLGADDCLVHGNYCSGTSTGNNIYVTASDGGQVTTNIIYRCLVSNNHCVDAIDTNIEFSINTQYSCMIGNIVTGSYNSALLGRDCKYCLIADNIINCPPFAEQAPNFAGISLAVLHEASTYEYQTVIRGNTIYGRAATGGIYSDGNKVDIINNRIIDNVTSVSSAGVGLVGRGVVIASGGRNFRISDNYIENVEEAIQCNLAADARVMINWEINRNTIIGVTGGVTLFNMTVTNSEILDNTISKVVSYVVQAASATYAGQLRYWGNAVTLGGFTGVSPVVFNPASAQRTGLMTDPNMKYLLVPETLGAAVVLATGDEPNWGDLIIQFTDLSQVALFDLGGRSGIGTGTTLKRIGTAGLLPSADSGGSVGWSVYYDGSNNLIFECRADTGAGPRYMKTLVRTV